MTLGCHVSREPPVGDHYVGSPTGGSLLQDLGHGLDIRGKALAGIFGGMPPHPHKLAST